MKVDIKGLKCDSPGCDWKSMEIPASEYPEWVNAKCPKCGAIVLTQADFDAVQFLLQVESFVNESGIEDLPGNEEQVKMSVKFNGGGITTAKFEEK